MTIEADFAALIGHLCNDEHVVVEPGGPVAYGMYLDHDMFMEMTPSCSLVQREQIFAELDPWQRRQIEQSVAEANALTDRVVASGRSRRRAPARRPSGSRR